MIYKKIFQKIIFPLSEIINKTSIQEKLEFLEVSQYWSRKKIEQYQDKKLRELILHSYNNVPYYKKLFDNLNIKPSDIQTKKDLKKIPVLTKEIIKKNEEDLRAKNYLTKSYGTYTSGSTGSPMKFYQTKENHSWIWAAEFRSWKKAGYLFGDKYVKFSLNPRKKRSKKIQDFLMRCYYIYILRTDKSEIKKELEKIMKFKPKFLYGYTSTISIIAEYMKENDITLKVDGIFTFGDNLTPRHKKIISQAFQTTVYDAYGCGGEGLNIASQCEKGSYHVNDELLIVEIDKNNNIIVTGLNNYAMPLIRYMPNDLVTLGTKCTCKRNLSILKSIDGRSKDIITSPNGNKLVVHFFTTFFEYKENIKHFKIIQKNKDGITIELVTKKGYKKTEEKDIEKYIHKATGENFIIKFNYLKDMPLEKNGKRKIIDSKINN